MGNFNRGNRQGDDRGNKNFGGGRPSHMYPATCTTCGKECEVPFRPTGNRPTYCSDCFHKQGNQSAGRSRERNFDRPRFEERRKAEWQADNSAGSIGLEQVRAQLEQMNNKLDRILNALYSAPRAAETIEEEAAVPKKAAKKAKGKKKK